MPPQTPQSTAAQSRETKQRIHNCLHKLSDRDTYSFAALELESIAKTLSTDTLPLYLSSISATDASDKSPVRKQCLKLISVLSERHGNALSPYLSKLLSAVTRRLRDTDSFVRSACVAATASIAVHVTKPPFSLIAKPFLEALFTEQDMNSQIGASMCLSAAVDAAPEPDVTALRKSMPRFEKLVKSDSFKAKAALLTLIGSVIAVGGTMSQQMVRNLVLSLMEFVSSKDWAARKAAAEALAKLAVVERDALTEFKASCLKTFEAKRFDKVKAVRETMNQMVAAWNEIPDLLEEASPPPQSQSASKEISSDGRYRSGSKISGSMSTDAPQVRKKSLMAKKSSIASSFPTTTIKEKSPLDSNNVKEIRPAMFRKLNHKKPSDHKAGDSVPRGRSEITVSDDDTKGRDETELEVGNSESDRLVKPETRRALFNKNSDDTMRKLTGSRVVPCLVDMSDSSIVVSNEIGDRNENPKESEDLSLIQKQLVQIETQQSNLLDLLQRFIGRSESGMNSLESRVHGLELALDDISFDWAMKTRRMSDNDSVGTICCKLPGTRFFASKLWKRTEGQSSTSQLPASRGTPLVAAMRNLAQTRDAEALKLEDGRNWFRGGHGIIVNPLADTPSSTRGISEPSSVLQAESQRTFNFAV